MVVADVERWHQNGRSAASLPRYQLADSFFVNFSLLCGVSIFVGNKNWNGILRRFLNIFRFFL